MPERTLTLSEVRQLLGYLTVTLVELHTIEIPRLNDALEQFLVRLDTPPRREHIWEFYMNGSFCRRCGASIGDGRPCT